ncbi:MAG: NAD(P)-dependent alcohol dehydrogenase [Phycisphaeraceae bacterium]|nr:MAG: NAD(P)-dependent alcohol dehydrogenase [Phycisphaeraceae bacterium]
MKAAVYSTFGPPEVVRIQERPDPIPTEQDVLIRVHATTVTTADWRVRARVMPAPIFTLIAPLVLGLRGPRKPVLGTECAGVVERVGARVTAFRPGDRVIAVTDFRMGAHAELVCAREGSALTTVPANLSFDQAVAIPFGALVALRYLRDLARVTEGQRVLVIGASGAIGVAAVQLARRLGAHVTGVCSTANVALVRSLGAAAVIDRLTEDFRQGGAVYDVVLDTVGATSFAECKNLLTPSGQFLAVLMGLTEFGQMAWTRLAGGRRVRGAIVSASKADLVHLMSLAEAGHLKPVIDSMYPLRQIVEAHRRVDSGRKVGSVVVTVP